MENKNKNTHSLNNKKYCPITSSECRTRLCELWIDEEQKCGFTLLAINSNHLQNLNDFRVWNIN